MSPPLAIDLEIGLENVVEFVRRVDKATKLWLRSSVFLRRGAGRAAGAALPLLARGGDVPEHLMDSVLF